jgi:hypothetical protein
MGLKFETMVSAGNGTCTGFIAFLRFFFIEIDFISARPQPTSKVSSNKQKI